MFSLMLQRLITHPRRGLIVMTVTLLAGLLFLLPAIDSYQHAGSRLSDLAAELDSHHDDISRLETWRSRCEEQRKQVAILEARAIATDELDGLRSRLVDVVHQSRCTLRRISIGEPRLRDWMNEGDNPLEDRPPEGATGETPYLLETRQLALIAEGPLGEVKQLLAALEKTDGLIHAATMTVRQADHADGVIALEINMVLMNLVDKPAEPA